MIGVLTASVLVLAACGDSDTSERTTQTAATLATTQAPTTAVPTTTTAATPTSAPPEVTTSSPVVASAPADLAPGTIVTVVGTGQPGIGNEGLGGPATEARLRGPIDLAFDADGNLYIAGRFSHRILRVDPSGILTIAAGKLTERGTVRGFSGDGGPATEAELHNASAIAVGRNGNLYISDSGNHRIRMVDADGIITTVAGTGEQGFSGDGGPATQAALNDPLGLASDGQGNLYFWDSGNYRVRMVDEAGIITTVAGTGERGSSPDGTPAIEASLGSPSDHPQGLGFDAAGRLHITDLGNSRIWMIDSEGRLRAVAGSGETAYSGDGGPATEAGLNGPMGIAIGPDGSLYIATHTHAAEGHRVRVVDRDGIITTIAGTETAGYSGDGGPATEAELNIPAAVAIGPDGNLYIADSANRVIRMVAQ